MVVGGGSGVCGGGWWFQFTLKEQLNSIEENVNGMNHESCRKEWVGNVPIF